MFATLLGALPRPTTRTDDIDRLIEVVIRAQEDAGLEPLTDGRLRDANHRAGPTAEQAVEAWRATQAMTARAVKVALPGPFSSGASAEGVAEVVAALASAGCPLVEVEETAMDRLASEAGRTAFRRQHERLVAAAGETHLSLSIVGGTPSEDAWSTILGLPYASLAVDLIDGPDSWNLVTRWPGERGVVAGVQSARNADEPKELLLWAAHYAASTNGRGLARVGLGSAGSFANLSWAAAVRKMRILGDAARLATKPPSGELARSVDPRAITSRHAALGHDV
jgi:methionine synthase II (cobalamin-independent)